MTKLLLSIHVLAVILAVGPIAVAASMFPAFARRAAAEGGAELGSLRTLHRVCRVYAVVGIAIPMFGLPLADLMGVLASPWLIASLVLTGAAAAVLVFVVLPDSSVCWPSWAVGARSMRGCSGDWRCSPGFSTCCGRW
ncbi:putative integral membrane protein [Mycobacteroides abscessus MAB_091912_2446]|uniref:Putative integral membrane protein n=1 Tax=Mycobacteroides abscessus MAB_091912_2446 TaxID=1335414 RepID=A0A829M725_9MYCO|nr:putative integral membrane protein [Mycobacteroides abscessus MAB_091912_2446]